MIRIALIARRLAQHHLGVDAACAQCVAHQLGMHDADAEDQPAPPVPGMADNLIAGAVDDIELAGDRLELLGDELAATLADIGHIDDVLVAFDDNGDRKPSRMPCPMVYS